LAVIFGEDLFWRQREILLGQNFFARPKLCLSQLAWLHTTGLTNAFDSIWHSALFHQLIALDFPLSFPRLYLFFSKWQMSRNNFLCFW